MSIVDLFADMTRSIDPTLRHDIVRGMEGDEQTVSVTVEGKNCMANASLWERPHVGGLVDFSVLDSSGRQILWRHLEGPSEAELHAGWNEMMQAIASLERS